MGKHFKSGKHSGTRTRRETEKKKKTKIFPKMLILLLVLLLVILGVNYIKDPNKNILKITKENNSTVSEVDINNIPDKMGEYKVLGVLKIEKIGIEKNILEETTDAALNLSVTKFYGPNLNEVGNFCITGHNYKDIFEKANELEQGDTFDIVSKENREKVTYKIYDKYTVTPTELECLSQETDGKKEATLITCNPGGTTRLILKAKEI